MALKDIVPVVVPLVLLVAGGAFFWSHGPPSPASLQSDAPSFSDFTVDTAAGPLALSDLQGKVVAVYFGYASCPDICPTTLSTVGAGFKELSAAEQAQVAGLMVSVDPERDTLERLAEYAAFFHPSFRAGTASAETLATIGADWGVRWEKVQGASVGLGYTVDHTSIVFLVGPDGRMAKALPHGSSPEVIAESVRALLSTGLALRESAPGG